MKLLLFLLSISITIVTTEADDFIRKKDGVVFRVQKCILKKNQYNVTPCYSQNGKICETKYSPQKYICLPSKGCGFDHVISLINDFGLKTRHKEGYAVTVIGENNKSIILGYGDKGQKDIFNVSKEESTFSAMIIDNVDESKTLYKKIYVDNGVIKDGHNISPRINQIYEIIQNKLSGCP